MWRPGAQQVCSISENQFGKCGCGSSHEPHGDYHANCYWTFSWTVLRKTARQHIFGLINCGEISARICVARAFAAIFVGEVVVEDRSGLDWIDNN